MRKPSSEQSLKGKWTGQHPGPIRREPCVQSAEGYFNLAVYASRVGDDTRALEALNKAHEIDETDPDILHNRALIFRRLVSSTEGSTAFQLTKIFSCNAESLQRGSRRL